MMVCLAGNIKQTFVYNEAIFGTVLDASLFLKNYASIQPRPLENISHFRHLMVNYWR